MKTLDLIIGERNQTLSKIISLEIFLEKIDFSEEESSEGYSENY